MAVGNTESAPDSTAHSTGAARRTAGTVIIRAKSPHIVRPQELPDYTNVRSRFQETSETVD